MRAIRSKRNKLNRQPMPCETNGKRHPKRIRPVRAVAGWLLLAALALALPGCGAGGDNRTARESLGLAVSGLLGSDSVRCQGTTALTVGGEQRSFRRYEGRLQDHQTLLLYPQLSSPSPSKGEGKTAGSGTRKRSLPREEPFGAVSLTKKNGSWTAMKSADLSGAGAAPFNPVAALEEMESLEGDLSYEQGAGPGRVRLKLKLAPEAARTELQRELEREMSDLKKSLPSGREAALRLWAEENSRLQARLASAEVETVYRLDIDSRRYLPKRLSRTRTVREESAGANVKETETSAADFDRYR
ncbi:hypothetical protein F4V43_11535 [Paenibacillus spiritus]|uniref:Lipoprotein n=1 Tax=Paenibacillus spiritus TaxID=2496557 RepID=A0A5J5G999_9BACL|nr:hypothetical protein [Paenibacillus spiritus]KAA9004033.1 hypothetical protein F4V43_11535 [Paenibacillus spiritus]